MKASILAPQGVRFALPHRIFSCEEAEHHQSLRSSVLGFIWTKANKEIRKFLFFPLVLLHHPSIWSTLELLKPFRLLHCSDISLPPLEVILVVDLWYKKHLRVHLKWWSPGVHYGAAEAGWQDASLASKPIPGGQMSTSQAGPGSLLAWTTPQPFNTLFSLHYCAQNSA